MRVADSGRVQRRFGALPQRRDERIRVRRGPSSRKTTYVLLAVKPFTEVGVYRLDVESPCPTLDPPEACPAVAVAIPAPQSLTTVAATGVITPARAEARSPGIEDVPAPAGCSAWSKPP